MLENMSLAFENALKNSVLNLIKWILTGVINSSFWVCLIICMLSLIIYACGQRKAGKYVSISFITYVILQCIKESFL